MGEHMYLSCEKIRLMQDPPMKQKEFAEYLGLSMSSYQHRVYGTQPDWRFDEVVKMANINGGKVLVDNYGTKYKVDIEKIDG